MPVFFRRPRPSRRVTGGFKRFLPGTLLHAGVGAASGVATATATAVAIIAAVGSTAGTSSVSGVGVAIKAMSGSAAGLASASSNGVGIKATIGASFGTSSVLGVVDPYQITTTHVLHKPVDFQLAGDQPYSRRAVGDGLRRRIFNE